ncbi:hypothetical protein B9Z55_026939 [Caenorhabditis nigoni]|nr:hypothetical protein B9Z55_026939 [Caenorhabditis nigoni]
MEMSPDLIKENHRYLKTCILYEVLQKMPIFDSYRNFCNTVGKDAMDYPDFEFWYYRFYHGNRDVDYDRSTDPESKTLEDIPVVLMKKIAENLDPVERTYLRSMNHALKTVADFFPPVFEKIEISISDMTMDWTLNNKRFYCCKKNGGCKLYRPNCAVEKSEMCHIKKGLEYLAPVLKIPNIQENLLSLHLFEQIADRDDLLPVPFNAKRVHFWSQNMNKVIEYLSALNPGHLESISLDSLVSEERENHGILFETDQFKQAKRAEFKYYWGFNVEVLVNFSHLHRFKCQIRIDNTFEDVPRIRVILSTFEELESCELELIGPMDRVPMRELADALGEDIPTGPLAEGEHLTIIHRYRIPDSNKCLVFKINDGESWYRVEMHRIR